MKQRWNLTTRRLCLSAIMTVALPSLSFANQKDVCPPVKIDSLGLTIHINYVDNGRYFSDDGVELIASKGLFNSFKIADAPIGPLKGNGSGSFCEILQLQILKTKNRLIWNGGGNHLYNYDLAARKLTMLEPDSPLPHERYWPSYFSVTPDESRFTAILDLDDSYENGSSTPGIQPETDILTGNTDGSGRQLLIKDVSWDLNRNQNADVEYDSTLRHSLAMTSAGQLIAFDVTANQTLAIADQVFTTPSLADAGQFQIDEAHQRFIFSMENAAHGVDLYQSTYAGAKSLLAANVIMNPTNCHWTEGNILATWPCVQDHNVMVACTNSDRVIFRRGDSKDGESIWSVDSTGEKQLLPAQRVIYYPDDLAPYCK